eukprot:707249-Prymnesium_polylepis.5
MKKLAKAHDGFFDEFNSNEEIGNVQKAKHAYINPNVVKNLLPSSTERVRMSFHGKYSTLTETSGNLVRAVCWQTASQSPTSRTRACSIASR